MCLTHSKSLLLAMLAGLTLGGMGAATGGTEEPKLEKPLHFVERPDMRPQLEARLPQPVVGELTEEDILVASKMLISDLRSPGRIRLRDMIDPRYPKKHGLTD